MLVPGGAVWSGGASATGNTRVFINGDLTEVHFNDGDSFRVFSGEYRGSQCRLAAFNTLESFGPAHQWGSWHPYELYVNAKMATANGRRGTWHCETDGSRDGYGRLLVECPDLIVDQVSKGLAHVLNVDDTPSRPEYLRAQQEAIRNRRGMWAHGVPDFVLTSLHSADEDRSRATHYNRLVSTRDGHSEPWEHNDTYQECEWVCATEIRTDPAAIHDAGRRLRANERIAPLVRDRPNIHLEEAAARFRRLGVLPDYIDGPAEPLIRQQLTADRAAGRLGQVHQERGACAIYVAFERRYGRNSAACLRGHGNWHGGPG